MVWTLWGTVHVDLREQTERWGHAGSVRDTRDASAARFENEKQTTLGTGSTGLD